MSTSCVQEMVSGDGRMERMERMESDIEDLRKASFIPIVVHVLRNTKYDSLEHEKGGIRLRRNAVHLSKRGTCTLLWLYIVCICPH